MLLYTKGPIDFSFQNQENTWMHYEMIQTISDVCKLDCPAFSSPNIYTEVKFFILSLPCFSNNFHSHDYNKEESKTALYGTKSQYRNV